MYDHLTMSPKDFHLAKRHYDLALATNTEAYFPVTLSLIKLRIRKFWHTTILRDHKHGVSHKRIVKAHADTCRLRHSA